MTPNASRSPLEELQAWYHAHCDGDWEHEHELRIESIDNPGWSLSIPLAGTELENRPFTLVRRDGDFGDWVLCRVEDRTFRADGGSRNLSELLLVFLDWAGDWKKFTDRPRIEPTPKETKPRE